MAKNVSAAKRVIWRKNDKFDESKAIEAEIKERFDNVSCDIEDGFGNIIVPKGVENKRSPRFRPTENINYLTHSNRLFEFTSVIDDKKEITEKTCFLKEKEHKITEDSIYASVNLFIHYCYDKKMIGDKFEQNIRELKKIYKKDSYCNCDNSFLYKKGFVFKIVEFTQNSTILEQNKELYEFVYNLQKPLFLPPNNLEIGDYLIFDFVIRTNKLKYKDEAGKEFFYDNLGVLFSTSLGEFIMENSEADLNKIKEGMFFYIKSLDFYLKKL